MFIEDDSLSSILGWVSIACWIVVYSPQIYENYTLQSGEGLSVPFVVIWLLGDLFNLVGAALAGLLPTVIILALYYSLCDVILLCQIYYYRFRRGRLTPCDSDDEQTPLLIGDVHEEQQLVSNKTVVARYTAALTFVIVVGIAAWWISNAMHQGGEAPEKCPKSRLGWEIQVLGWSSAILYLGARIPQIIKNIKTRCEGLSPALFFFAIFGNVTYALSICAKSMDRQYLFTNAGWLAGSALTVFMDLIVLCQFFYYRSTDGVLAHRSEGSYIET